MELLKSFGMAVGGIVAFALLSAGIQLGVHWLVENAGIGTILVVTMVIITAVLTVVIHSGRMSRM